MNIEMILSKLLTGTHTIFFKKVSDGSIRKMKCTLSKEEVNESDRAKIITDMKTKKVIPIWDVEKNGWRSFRVDSLIRFEDDSDGENKK